MDEFAAVMRHDAMHRNLRDPAALRVWARALGIPESELAETIRMAGASAEAVLSYLHSPD